MLIDIITEGLINTNGESSTKKRQMSKSEVEWGGWWVGERDINHTMVVGECE